MQATLWRPLPPRAKSPAHHNRILQFHLALFAEFAPELVLLDIGMPGMDGFETARRMRELPAGRKATLVGLTGWAEEETRKRMKEAGFDRHITKPADIGELEALLGCGPQEKRS